MLPILDKPLIQYGVEEAVAAGLTEIAIVTGRGKRAIEDHFDRNVELQTVLRDTPKWQHLDELECLIDSCTIAYTRQREMLGTGNAVLTGQVIIGDSPFAVVLADDLCFNDGPGVLAQMVELYDRYQSCIVAVEEIPAELSRQYGVIDGVKQGDGTYLVNNLIEKPEPQDAPSNLGVVGRYILTPTIFSELELTQPGYGGEIQLTDALKSITAKEKVIACQFQGIRFDCGSIPGFVDATNHCYQQSRP